MWHKEDREHVGQAVIKTAQALARELEPLRRMWRTNLRYVLDRPIDEVTGTTIGALDYKVSSPQLDALDRPATAWNKVAASVDSFCARACSQKVLPRVLTSGAGELEQGRSKAAEKFGHTALRQMGINQLDRRATRLAAICGTAFIKVYESGKTIKGAVVGPDKMLVAPCDDDRRPTQAFHVEMLTKDVLSRLFDGDSDDDTRVKALIDIAKPIVKVDGAYELLEVFEAWQAGDEGSAGRHVIAIKEGLLLDEEWTLPVPIAVLRHKSGLEGFHGVSYVEGLLGPQIELSDKLGKIRAQSEALSRAYLQMPSNAPTAQDEDVLSSVEDGFLMLPPGYTPVFPPSFNAQDLQLVKENEQQIALLSGMSESASMGLTPAGMTSGVAQRTYYSLGTARLAEPLENRAECIVRLLELALDLGSQLDNWTFTSESGSTISELSWHDLDLDRGAIHVRAVVASALPEDIGGKLELVDSLVSKGVLPVDAYFKLLAAPDWEAYSAEQTAPRDCVEYLCELAIQDKPLPELSPLMDVKLLVRVGTAYYNRAVRAGMEQDVLDRLEMLVTDAMRMIAPPPAPQAPAPPSIEAQQAALAAEATQTAG